MFTYLFRDVSAVTPMRSMFNACGAFNHRAPQFMPAWIFHHIPECYPSGTWMKQDVFPVNLGQNETYQRLGWNFLNFLVNILIFLPRYEKKGGFASTFIEIYKGYKIWAEQHVSINALVSAGRCMVCRTSQHYLCSTYKHLSHGCTRHSRWGMDDIYVDHVYFVPVLFILISILLVLLKIKEKANTKLELYNL